MLTAFLSHDTIQSDRKAIYATLEMDRSRETRMLRTMHKTIKAHCVNGALAPLEPVELREGDECLITFDARPPHSSTITSSVD